MRRKAIRFWDGQSRADSFLGFGLEIFEKKIAAECFLQSNSRDALVSGRRFLFVRFHVTQRKPAGFLLVGFRPGKLESFFVIVLFWFLARRFAGGSFLL